MTTIATLIQSSTHAFRREGNCILCLGASLEGWFLSALAASLFFASLFV